MTQYKYMSLGFFRCDSNAYKDSLDNNPFIFIDQKTPRDLNIEYRNLLCWGHSDIVTFFLFNSPERFVDFQKICPSNNKIYEDYYSSGILIQPIDLKDLSKMDELPLCGISFIKLADTLFNGIKEGGLKKLVESVIWDEIQKLTNKDKDIFPLLIFSYGWEDLILILFSNRYDAIKELIFNLRRNLKFKNLESVLVPSFFDKNPNTKHAITTTYTIFAAHLPFSKSIDAISIELRKKLNAKDKMVVDKMNFQIRPGHLDYVIEELKKKNCKIAHFQFMPGRYDLSVKFENMKIYDLFEFYLKELWPFLESKTSPIISTQTLFKLNDINAVMEENVACNNPKEYFPIPREEMEFIEKHVYDSYLLPVHSAISLGNILVSSWYLKNNFFISGAMKSLIRFINTMKDGIQKEAHLQQAVDEISPPLSLCFIDRFRGTYPLGESFSMPIMNYKGSFQKHLLCVDYSSFIIFNVMRECLNIQGEQIEKHYFCSFIGARFSPAIISFNVDPNKYNLGIVSIPIDSLFSQVDLYYMFHEMAHMVIFSIDLDNYISLELLGFRNMPNHSLIIEAVERLLKDMVADYFMLIFGFEGNLTKFEDYFSTYVRKIYRVPADEEKFRISIVKVIFSNLNSPHEALSKIEIVKNEFARSEWEYREAGRIAASFLYQEIANEEELFDILKKVSNFMNMKNKISSYSALDSIKQYINSGSIDKWLSIYRDYYCDEEF